MEEKKCCITFSKVTAFLCALTMLFALIAFFSSKPMAKIDVLNDQIKFKKEAIAQVDESITQLQKTLADYQQEKQQNEATLSKAKEDLSHASAEVSVKQEALTQAEANLDKVCSRSSYSSWSCRSNCYGLHNAVSDANAALSVSQDNLNDYQYIVESVERDIESLTRDIARTEDNILNAQDRIATLNKEIKELAGKRVGAWFGVIFQALATLLALAGLCLLAKNFYTEAQNNFTLYAVAGLAASSLLFLITGAINNPVFQNAPLGYFLLSPHTWNIAIMALFASVLMKKAPKPVAIRNIAVVLSVILGLLIIVSGAPFIGVLYTATIICSAFVIVPLVFTEYIDIAKHIFLSMITFGIWQLVWIYHVTKNLNNVAAVENRKPVRELLCMFLPFYYPYWLYKTAEGVEDYGKEKGKEFKIDILCIAFAFICPVFATVLIQNKINVVVGKPVCEDPVIEEVCEEPVVEEVCE